MIDLYGARRKGIPAYDIPRTNGSVALIFMQMAKKNPVKLSFPP